MQTYKEFLLSKEIMAESDGMTFDDSDLNPLLFPFQKDIVTWALHKGRAAIFADCGLGKTPMQLTWASMVAKYTDKPVLVLTPLAVASQTISEASKFGIDAYHSRDGFVRYPITVTNYERLHYFNPDDFGGVVCDESSILKSFDGVRKAEITEFMRQIDFRLLCTATAAPNDYIELGTSSEALGYLGYIDMLNMFFTNKMNTTDTKRYRGQGQEWRFKGHAEDSFWRWVSSWARALRSPADLGYNGDDFILPSIDIEETLVKARTPRPDMLFDVDAIGMREEREVRRRTIQERCELAATKVNDTSEPAVIWCHLNPEGDLLEKLIPDAIQISGRDTDESKEDKLKSFSSGESRVLIIKPKIGAFGLNWQHCAHVVYFVSYSYEQYYQAVRRCWRFGQTKPVKVDVIGAESDSRIFASLQSKSRAADQMFTDLTVHMNDALGITRTNIYTNEMEMPSWL